MLEVAADCPRARDVWRRLRFVVDQARAFTDAEHAGLRGYLAWQPARPANRSRRRVHPPGDRYRHGAHHDIHAAKGLEFPIVIVSGMTSRVGGAVACVIDPVRSRSQITCPLAAGRMNDRQAGGVSTCSATAGASCRHWPLGCSSLIRRAGCGRCGSGPIRTLRSSSGRGASTRSSVKSACRCGCRRFTLLPRVARFK
jgi:hypothetical protein